VKADDEVAHPVYAATKRSFTPVKTQSYIKWPCGSLCAKCVFCILSSEKRGAMMMLIALTLMTMTMYMATWRYVKENSLIHYLHA